MNNVNVVSLQVYFLEHLFVDLFKLRDRFKVLGMVTKGGNVYLPDLEPHG